MDRQKTISLAQVVLPDAGFDLEDYAGAISIALGSIVGAVLAVSLAFLVIRRGIRELHTFDGRRR